MTERQHTAGHDGTPQPGSQPLSKEEAEQLVKRTGGQMQAFLASDGHWYVYAPKPVEVAVTPKVATDPNGGARG
jgi:hypothetical protein